MEKVRRLAAGAVATGALAIRALAVKRGRIGRLHIEELEVGRPRLSLPASFFLSVLSPDSTEPNALIYLAYIGGLAGSGAFGVGGSA